MSKANIVKGINKSTDKVMKAMYEARYRVRLIEKIKQKLHKLTSKDRDYLVRLLK